MAIDFNLPLSRVLRQKAMVSKLAHLGVENLGELLWYPPRRMYRWGELTRFDQLNPGTEVTVFAVVLSATLGMTQRYDKAMLTVTLRDELEDAPGLGRRGNFLTVRFFAKHTGALQFHANRLRKGTLAVFAGKLSGKPGGKAREAFLAHPEYQVLADYDPQMARSLSTRPQPLYHATAGLPSWKIAKLIDAQLLLLAPDEVPEALPESLRQKQGLVGAYQALQWLHHPDTEEQHQRALDYLRFREALILGAALAKTRAQTRSRLAWPLPAASLPLNSGVDEAPLDSKPNVAVDLVSQVVSGLPFTLTAGQQNVWNEIAAELSEETPMNRLLQGEVGSGKTVVAALAGVAAVQNGCQAALMVPTEVLASQHYQSLQELLGAVADDCLYLLTASTPAQEKAALQTRIAAGEPLFVVGTHALVAKGTRFTQLGVAIIDEQHRFGVEQRMALAAAATRAPHFLAMTATPIPRTVAMTVFGDLDISSLTQQPKGRKAVQTFLVPENNVVWVARCWQRAAEEIQAGGRVYVLCPKISSQHEAPGAEMRLGRAAVNFIDHEGLEDIGENRVLHTVEETAARLRALPIFSGVELGMVHSGLDAAAKQEAISDFASGKTPLLVSTTVVEVGMDVPQATMMIILDADRFGLSQLHQLRGRIGRGTKSGVCLAIAPLEFPPAQTLDAGAADMNSAGKDQDAVAHAKRLLVALEGYPPAVARLVAFRETHNGFTLAEADLSIRREGDILGATQSGRRSKLQILSLQRDAEIIAAGKVAAAEIVHEDRQLRQHPELARLVFALGESGQNLAKA